MLDRKDNFFGLETVSRRKFLAGGTGLLLLACQNRPAATWEISFPDPKVSSAGRYRLGVDGGYFLKHPRYHHDFLPKSDLRLNVLIEVLGRDLVLNVELGRPNQNTYLDGWNAVIPNPNFNVFHMFVTTWSNWRFTQWGFDAGRYPLPANPQPPERLSTT